MISFATRGEAKHIRIISPLPKSPRNTGTQAGSVLKFV
jgi:hypothetical protein